VFPDLISVREWLEAVVDRRLGKAADIALARMQKTVLALAEESRETSLLWKPSSPPSRRTSKPPSNARSHCPSPGWSEMTIPQPHEEELTEAVVSTLHGLLLATRTGDRSAVAAQVAELLKAISKYNAAVAERPGDDPLRRAIERLR
jgi:hypothetical protein